jgi:hypothetical protein
VSKGNGYNEPEMARLIKKSTLKILPVRKAGAPFQDIKTLEADLKI